MEKGMTSGGGPELKSRFKSPKSMSKEQKEIENFSSGRTRSHVSRKRKKWR